MIDIPFTLDQLRILKAIAAEGSFKRAADSLYVSQPAVSLQVQHLERQLDVPLFDRGGRRARRDGRHHPANPRFARLVAVGDYLPGCGSTRR